MPPMNDLHAVDLNLWAVLEGLLETHSVTSTAARLGRTQSAVSHSLSALRALFGDPLLVRVGNRLEPTPRARTLEGPVREALAAMRRTLAPAADFSPRTLQRTFRLYASDYGQVVLLPGLLRRLAAHAPGVVVDVRFQSDATASSVAQLAAGELDLAIAARLPSHSGVMQQRLFADRDVVVLRKRHPDARRLTAERFAALPHVQVSPRGLERDFVDEALARKGLTRKVVARIPHFVAAPLLVAHSDAVAVVPERVAQAWAGAQTAPVRFVESPVPLPHFTMSQFFPEVLRKAPEHLWLRQLVKEVAQS